MAQPNKQRRSLPALVTFSLVASALLIEANIVFYWAFINVFGIVGHHTRVILAIVLFLLSGGFIGMLFIERKTAGFLTRFFYLLTASWTGMFAYLFIAAALYDISNAILMDAQPFGLAVFIIAIATGLYGIMHAQHIVVKKISVKLPNLPEAWRGRTAVWMSDLHLGSVRGARFSAKVTKLSNSLSPDIVFIGGDLYDGTHAPDPFAIAKPLKNLSSKFGTIYITGNHEEFGDPGQFLSAVHALGMRILQDEMTEIEGLQILGVDYSHAAKKDQFETILKNFKLDHAKSSILLKHEPKDLDVAEAAGVSFQISGHTHNGQQWPFNYLANMAYKGYGYGQKMYKTMEVYVSSGIGGWGPPVRVGSDCEIVAITFD